VKNFWFCPGRFWPNVKMALRHPVSALYWHCWFRANPKLRATIVKALRPLNELRVPVGLRTVRIQGTPEIVGRLPRITLSAQLTYGRCSWRERRTIRLELAWRDSIDTTKLIPAAEITSFYSRAARRKVTDAERIEFEARLKEHRKALS